MKLLIYFAALAATITFGVRAVQGADDPCDCTIFPFRPEPPCFNRCVCKHMAIASENDLKKVFGLPDHVAETIAGIKPSDRPRSLELYRNLVPSPAYEALLNTVHTLTTSSFAQVRNDARALAGWTIDQLKW